MNFDLTKLASQAAQNVVRSQAVVRGDLTEGTPTEVTPELLSRSEIMAMNAAEAFAADDSSGGGLALAASQEALAAAEFQSARRRAAFKEWVKNDRSKQRVQAAKAEKAKRKKMQKRGH